MSTTAGPLIAPIVEPPVVVADAATAVVGEPAAPATVVVTPPTVVEPSGTVVVDGSSESELQPASAHTATPITIHRRIAARPYGTM